MTGLKLCQVGQMSLSQIAFDQKKWHQMIRGYPFSKLILLLNHPQLSFIIKKFYTMGG
jgi:hypothetical protein